MAGVRDWFGNVEQKVVIQEYSCVRVERRRRPILLIVAHIPVGKTLLEALKEHSPVLACDGEWRLLVPQVANVLDARTVVQAHVGLLGTTDPVKTQRQRPNRRSRGERNGFGNYAEERSLVSVERASGIKLDHNTKHVVVLQQVGNGPHVREEPRQIKWVGSQPRKDAENAVGSGCPVLVVDHYT